jgi:hypothetical protein
MGLLNAVAAGLGGAASSMADSYGRRNEAIEGDRIMKERQRLEMERTRAVEAMREEFSIRGEARKRDAALTQAREIEAGVRDAQDKRISDRTQAPVGPSLSPEDVRAKRDQPGGSPISGLLNSTRRSEAEDRASVAAKLGYADAAKEYRNEARDEARSERDDVRDARENKRIDAQIAHQDKQLNAQIAHWEDIKKRSGGSGIEGMLAKAKLEEFQMQRAWQMELSKTPVGSPERAALLQKGRDFEWIKDAPNDVTVTKKSFDENGNEITTTTKGVAQQTGAGPSKPFDPNDFRPKPSGAAKPASAPVRADAAPKAQERKSPKDMAIDGFDQAITKTARDLAAADRRGDKAEAARLNLLLQEQQRAKVRLVDGSGQ